MEIVAFDRRLDRSSFSCGKPDLDDWLKTKAGQQERANNTRTFLAVDGSRVIGYYATTAYRLGPEVAEDVTAETFLAAFRRCHYDASRRDARPWLYGIAARQIGKHRRAEMRPLRVCDELTSFLAVAAIRFVIWEGPRRRWGSGSR